MTALENIFYFIVALGVLVTIHEYGHFWVARKLGVKVVTFSVGFGKAIWQRRSKDGVNYQIAIIPLGGYVKMLDEREGEVSQEDRAYAFNRKSVWVRMAIVLAGPLANFILAIVLYWWIFIVGVTQLSTQVGVIDESSIAGKAGLTQGDVITHIDGYPVKFLRDVTLASALRIGEKTSMQMQVDSAGVNKTLMLDLNQWQVHDSQPDLLTSLGIRPAINDQDFAPVFSAVKPQSAADKGGLLAGDKVVSVDQTAIDSWNQLTREIIQPNPGKRMIFEVERQGELKQISVVLDSREIAGEQIGQLGVFPYISAKDSAKRAEYFKTLKGGIFESFALSLAETKRMTSITFRLFGKLVTGKLSLKNLSGPVSIAEGAGGSARVGLIAFLGFMAMVSINLGFINLLPIPVLDGGHFLYFLIEAVRGKALSEKTQELGMQLGMLMVLSLMAVAIFNDLSRF